MNKKADFILGQESILYFYKMLLLIIVTVFLVVFVVAFFYHEYDVRQREANILANRIAECYIHSGEARLSDFSIKPSERCGISFKSDEEYYSDIILETGFPTVKCEDILGKWEKTDKCSEDFVNLRSSVSDSEQLLAKTVSENWKCCVNNKDVKNVYLSNGFVIQDGGKGQEDLRVLCDVVVNGNRPKGDYQGACSTNRYNFVLISTSNEGIKRVSSSILIKTGFKKRQE